MKEIPITDREMHLPEIQATVESATTASRSEPSVSVVIAWVNPIELLLPGLEALRQQGRRHSVEVIVVSRRGNEEQERLHTLFPDVVLMSAPGDTPVTALRSMGIKRARGTIVAVTEDHCIPSDGWIATIEQNLRQPGCDIVGGPVENTATTRLRDWAAFLTEYTKAVRPVIEDESGDQIPGNNVAYRRELLGDICATLDRGLWESFCRPDLIKRGARLKFDSKMVTWHHRPFDFGYFTRHRYHYCRSFAGMRCQSFSTFQRLKYGFGSVLLPPLLLLRGLMTLVQKQRLVGRYLACSPLIGFYVTVGALGEMIGYFIGGGNSLARVD